MDEKLKQEIKAMVDDFFSEKEEADVRRKTEEALQKSAEAITELTTALEDKNAESEEASNKIAALCQQVDTLTSELEAAKKERCDVEAKLNEVSNLLEEKRKDEIASARVSELVKAGVGTVALSSKVREMLDDEFNSYLSERVELRNAVMTELSKKVETADIVTKEDAEKVEVEIEKEVAKVVEEEVVTPPAHINQSQAISAMMNFETVPSKGVVDKYAELGKAMAKIMTGNKDKD